MNGQMKCRHCDTDYCQHDWVPVESTEIQRGFTFLPESKTWVYRESAGRQSHLLPDGRMVDVIED